jgi:hypothetical protein
VIRTPDTGPIIFNVPENGLIFYQGDLTVTGRMAVLTAF